MSTYLGAFLLGNAAILGNVCVLPLYPGLIAFLAGTTERGRVRQGGVLLGAAVLAGVLATMMPKVRAKSPGHKIPAAPSLQAFFLRDGALSYAIITTEQPMIATELTSHSVETQIKAMMMGLLTQRSPAPGLVTECSMSTSFWIASPKTILGVGGIVHRSKALCCGICHRGTKTMKRTD